MLKNLALAAVFVAALSGCASTGPASLTRLDGTSVEAAERSFRQMRAELPAEEQHKLAVAMLTINVKGVKSAHEVAGDPGLQSPSIGRIRDEVAGMTAWEIIEYAAKVSTVRMEVHRK